MNEGVPKPVPEPRRIDSYGFTAAESIITEHAGPAPYDGVADAAFYAGVMSLLQDGIVSKATYYTGSPFVLARADQPVDGFLRLRAV